MKNAVPVDITCVTNVARIERVICNGSLAYKLYHRHLEAIVGVPAIALPSTSPANAACSFAQLVNIWKGALKQ